MANTATAVGCGVGIPAAVFIIMFLVLWCRQKLRYKKDLRENPDDPDVDGYDLDLENILRTNDKTVKQQQQQQNDSYPSNEDDDSDLTPQNDQLYTDDIEKGDDGQILRNKTYSIRKQSKIMGLKVVPPSQLHHVQQQQRQQQGSSSSGSTASFLQNNKALVEGGTDEPLSTPASKAPQAPSAANLHQNYINYYESVIPVLPPSSDLPHSASNSNSLTPVDDDHHSVASRQNSGHYILGNGKPSLQQRKSQMSLQAEYIKQLHMNDSSSFPKTTQQANASPSQINLLNNYINGSPNPSRTGSSLNLLHGNSLLSPSTKVTPNKSQHSLGLLSHKGSNHSLLILNDNDKLIEQETTTTSSDKNAGSLSPPASNVINSVTPPTSTTTESAADISVAPHSPIVPELKQSPFDTPPRQSHYIVDTLELTDDDYNESRDQIDTSLSFQTQQGSSSLKQTPVLNNNQQKQQDAQTPNSLKRPTSTDNTSLRSNITSSSKYIDATDGEATNAEVAENSKNDDKGMIELDEREKDYYSNYKSSKQQWKDSVKGVIE